MKSKYILLACLVGLAVFLGFNDSVLAADDAAAGGYLAGYENTDPRPSSISWWSTIAYLVSLFAIFIFVVGLAYFAARFLGGHFAKQKLGYGGKLLSHLPLGPNRSICVVKMAGGVYLLGVTEHSINLLATITDPEEIERLQSEQLTNPLPADMFSKEVGTLSDFVQKIPPIFRK